MSLRVSAGRANFVTPQVQAKRKIQTSMRHKIWPSPKPTRNFATNINYQCFLCMYILYTIVAHSNHYYNTAYYCVKITDTTFTNQGRSLKNKNKNENEKKKKLSLSGENLILLDLESLKIYLDEKASCKGPLYTVINDDLSPLCIEMRPPVHKKSQ